MARIPPVFFLLAALREMPRLQHKRGVMDCQGFQGRTRGKARGPEQGGTGALGPREPFPPVSGRLAFPPGSSLKVLQTSLRRDIFSEK